MSLAKRYIEQIGRENTDFKPQKASAPKRKTREIFLLIAIIMGIPGALEIFDNYNSCTTSAYFLSIGSVGGSGPFMLKCDVFASLFSILLVISIFIACLLFLKAKKYVFIPV